ncbi:hypothetical protein XcodCFBP4690_09825 [Xanthomonas codiaei]|uniref:Uncharacterized protein n=1 Tax=Xanthomonas codiaei TaxID=56463 RepID=A0A2S7CRJ1_9XANT|nr:hypothetical protein XcodCFBP4690_09825 [Xanthomonas codiaei]
MLFAMARPMRGTARWQAVCALPAGRCGRPRNGLPKNENAGTKADVSDPHLGVAVPLNRIACPAAGMRSISA